MTTRKTSTFVLSLLAGVALFAGGAVATFADEAFDAFVRGFQKDKPTFAKRQQDLLAARYDLANRPAQGVTMSGGKAVQEGVRVRLPKDMTWDKLAAMAPDEIKIEGPLAGGLLPPPPSSSRERGDDLPAAAHR